MKLAINLLLLALIGLLGFGLYSSIKEPIAFGDVKKARRNAVVDKLEKIRTTQEVYKLVTGKFANSFDSLIYTIKTDSVKIVKVIGDPDDPTNADLFQEIISYKPAIDSLASLGVQPGELDKLSLIPFTDGKRFDIAADTLTYQSTLVSVVEVGTKWKNFMGKYGDKKYAKYDNKYDPEKTIKFGDMNKPNISGNWER